MGQQGISAIQDAGNGVDLMGPQRNCWIDTHKVEMAPVVLPGADRVKFLVVEPRQPLPALRVTPNPVLERLLDKLLLALGNGGLLLIEHGDSVSMLVLHIIHHTD